MSAVRSLTLSLILVFMLFLAAAPAFAASLQAAESPQICSEAGALHALGVEGGLLSLLTSRSNPDPDPVAKIIKNGSAVVVFAANSRISGVIFQSSTC